MSHTFTKSIRIPLAMLERLKIEAERNTRTLSHEIVHRLSNSFSKPQPRTRS